MAIQLSGSLAITGSLLATSTITAQTLVVQTVTSSIVYSSGSNIFGNSLSNTQIMTGSVSVTGSSHSVFGSVGIGVIPSAWVGRPAIQTGGDGYIVSSNTNLILGANVFFNGSSRAYISNGFATDYRQLTGTHRWETAVSGTAGANISFNTAMMIDTDSRVLIATTANNGVDALQVAGNIRTSAYLNFTNPNSSIGAGTTNSGWFEINSGANPFNVRVNGGDRFHINTSGNVGIGTTSPQTLLDINGAGRFGNAATKLTTYSDSTYSGIFNGASLGSAESVYMGDGQMFFITSGSLKMRLNASGNLGLGVTPSAWGSSAKALQIDRVSISGIETNDLHLTSNAFWNGASWIYVANSVAATNYYQNAGAHVWRTAPSGTAGNAISFTQAMTLNTSGFLGIGTTSPAERLSVAGAIMSTGGITGHGANRTTISQEGGSGAFWQSYGANTSTVGAFVLRQASSDFSVVRSPLIIDTTGAATFSSSVTTGGSIISGDNIILSGELYWGGTTRARSFTTGASGSATLNYAFWNGSSWTIISTLSSTGAATFSSSVTATRGFFSSNGASDGTTALLANASTNDNTTFAALFGSLNAGYRMVVRADGNVGIGTTSPSQLLTVEGSTTEVLSVGTSSQKLFFRPDGSGVMISTSTNQAGEGIYFGNASDFMYFQTATAERMRITSGGNVGIGTTSPNSRLEVLGGIAHFAQTAANGSAFRWGSFGTAVSPDTMLCMNQLWNGSSWTILNSSFGTTAINLGSTEASPTIRFETGGANTVATTKMIILNNGNVGIGTNSPSAVLHTSSSTGTVRFASSTANDAGRIVLMEQSLDAWSVDGGSANGTFFIRDEFNSATRLAIANNGNVGIGTTSPNTTLDVNGTIQGSIITNLRQYHGIKTLIYGPTSAETINLATEFPQVLLTTGNTWAVYGRCNLFSSSGEVEVREFVIGRNTSGTWSSANYGPSSITAGNILQSVTGSGSSITINMNSGSYLTVELTAMIR